jgi:hypothetical protein
MRKSLWIILTVLLVAIGATNAHADTLNIPTFTCTPGPCGSTPTAPNVSFPGPPVTIDVTYDLVLFSIVLPDPGGLDLPGNKYEWTAYESAGTPVDFGITDISTGDSASIGVMSKNPTLSDQGLLTFAAPEPSTVVLMLIGVGFVFVMRKRLAKGFQQAS